MDALRRAAVGAAGMILVTVMTATAGAGGTSAAPGSGGELNVVDFPVRAAPEASGEVTVRSALVAEPLDAATMQDLQTYAKSSGRSLDQLVSAHQGIVEFSEFATKLEVDHAASYVRAGLSPDGQGYWIDLTTAPDKALLEATAALPTEVTLRYGAPASAAEIATLADDLTRTIAAFPAVIRSAGTSYDHDRRVLTLTYTPATLAGDASIEEVLNAALKAGLLATGELPLPVQLIRAKDRTAVAEVSVSGGADLNQDSTNHPECTAGFTAVRANRGVLTAEHCPNALRLGSSANAISANPAEPDYDAIDLQFHRTLTENGHTTDKNFRATSRSADGERTVTSVANAPMDSTVCHWGRYTGYDCDTVADQDRCETLSGHRYCGLDVTVNDISTGGDSGGPWFLGQTARGTHSGAIDGYESYFTRISRTSFLDATVLQN